jgi:hypothetical protein
LNKHYLPAIASLLIVAVLASSLLPVFANNTVRYQAAPTLVVKTIAEDDELRQTGIIVLADTMANFGLAGAHQKLLAQYKVIVTYNGIPVDPTSYTCQVIEKDKYNPLKYKQGTWENLATSLLVTDNFICKWREGKPGVGVIDLYYVGTASGQFIADYVVVVSATLTIGRTVVYGAEMQDVCVLGWPVDDVAPAWKITKPDGTVHWIWADPLGTFTSCEDAALQQKNMLGIPIPWT